MIVPYMDFSSFRHKVFYKFRDPDFSPKRHRRSIFITAGNGGFTLMEVMLVIFMLGILTTLAVPSLLRSNDRWVLRSTAYRIANDIRQVQRMSVRECEEYKFELHTGKFYYRIMRESVTADPVKTVSLDSGISEVTSTLYDPKYGGEMAGYRVLQFSCLGSPNQGGTILLKTKKGDSVRITVEVTTGRVHVYD